jgi:hypothetical protein
MRAFGYIAALSMIGAILVASTSFTDRRSVKTWAPSTVVQPAALVSPKHNAATGAMKPEAASLAPAPEQVSSVEAPATTRSSTTVADPETTGTLPKEVEPAAQYVAPKASPTAPRALRAWRQVTRPARQASARGRVMAQTRAAPAPSSREPIQFRLAEGRN